MSNIHSRFTGPDGPRLIAESLHAESLVGLDPGLAEEIAAAVTVEVVSAPHPIISQNGADNDLFFIIEGDVSVQVHGREVVRRRAGQHVGEMAVVDPSAPRSATVIPVGQCVVARLSESRFVELAEARPILWRRIAKQLGVRLRERNTLVSPRRDRPVLFVGASREGLPYANQVKTSLKRDPVTARVWTDNVFSASHFPLQDLETQLRLADFALLVATPDDSTTSRGITKDAPRDNVVFELGLFMGAMGHERTFVMGPRGHDIKLPSDLLGLTTLNYDTAAGGTLAMQVRNCVKDLRRLILTMGPR